ncbi:MAG: response regulator [Polyangia bacterium]
MTSPLVLIIDDNALNVQLLSFLLAAHGYEIRSATSVAEAEASLAEVIPHVILVDVCMPGPDGLTLVRRLKADPRTKEIPVVVVTASAMKGDDVRAREAGCDDYVTKPVDTRALPGRIAELLKK